MSEIEGEIIKKLMYHKEMSYNELWNKEYPSSKYNYYIKGLIQREVIEKNEFGKYQLTQKGNQYVAELSIKNLKKQTIPLTCTFVLCVNHEGKILLQERKKQPYLGLLNIPGGKVEFGENTYDAGVRELKEESNLEVKSMKLKSIDEIRTYYEDLEIFAHIITYMYVCYDFEGELELENLEGKMAWYDINELSSIKNIFPNLIEIIPKLIETKEILILETKRVKNRNDEFISCEIKTKN